VDMTATGIKTVTAAGTGIANVAAEGAVTNGLGAEAEHAAALENGAVRGIVVESSSPGTKRPVPSGSAGTAEWAAPRRQERWQ